MRKPRKETELALRIYAEMVRDPQPLTAEQLMERIGAPKNYVLPVLKARDSCGVMTSQKTPDGRTYTFTPEGFQYVRSLLEPLELSAAQWARIERKFNPPGRPRRR
jgi:DNA-binding transcriptional regulator GbsR (MarR family)